MSKRKRATSQGLAAGKMSASEKFCLRWNDFESNISVAFRELREEKDFFDVTLVSDDERQIPAHKLVLSACSDFFKSILRNNSHSNPLLYLSGIHSTNLSLILDYIYQGEVQIYQEHLDSFLEVAQKLKIEGLITATEDTEKSDVNVIPEPSIFTPSSNVQRYSTMNPS